MFLSVSNIVLGMLQLKVNSGRVAMLQEASHPLSPSFADYHLIKQLIYKEMGCSER